MMELNSSSIGKLVPEGHIYYFSKDCPVGIVDHMHVCIKHKDEYLIFSTCSSQINTSIRLAKIRGYNINTYPVFAPNKVNGFTEHTYINCNQVWTISEKQFGELYKEGKISNTKYDGEIDESGMAIIAKGVKLSTEIEDEIKELF